MTIQAEDIFIPLVYERKLAHLFRKSPLLKQNVELQQQIILWAKEMLKEARKEWNEIRVISVESIIYCNSKKEAIKRGYARDKKYAPFREYFKQLQRERFIIYQKQGKIMSANGFVLWFLNNQPKDMEIPYSRSNLKNKLIQLAQKNNREFKNFSK